MSTDITRAPEHTLEEKEAISIERIQRIAEEFPGSLYVMTSAGVDAAVMLNLVNEAGIDYEVIHLRTGFQPKQTPNFLRKLEDLYDFKAHVYGPSRWQIISAKLRWLHVLKPEEYSWRTKREPLGRAIGELGVRAMISGIRADQTPDRADMDERQIGHNGEYRIHPILSWTQKDIDDYITKNVLPRHPLYPKYISVEDKHYMVRGDGSGKLQKTECGIHTKDGRSTRAKRLFGLRWPVIITSHKEQS